MFSQLDDFLNRTVDIVTDVSHCRYIATVATKVLLECSFLALAGSRCLRGPGPWLLYRFCGLCNKRCKPIFITQCITNLHVALVNCIGSIRSWKVWPIVSCLPRNTQHNL